MPRLRCALARTVWASMTVACLASCGDGRPTKIVPEAAASTVRAVAQLRTTMATGDGFAVASQVSALGPQGALIVQPDEQQQQQRRQVRPGRGDRRFAVGTCQCDATGCVFTGCGDDAGNWTLDGTISVSQGVYSFDTHWRMDDGQGSTQDWVIGGDVTIDDTMIGGDLSGDGAMAIDDPDGTSVSATWAWDLDFNGITVDGGGCATGGDLDVSGDIKETVIGHTLHWSGSGTVAFPACGMAVVE